LPANGFSKSLNGDGIWAFALSASLLLNASKLKLLWVRSYDLTRSGCFCTALRPWPAIAFASASPALSGSGKRAQQIAKAKVLFPIEALPSGEVLEAMRIHVVEDVVVSSAKGNQVRRGFWCSSFMAAGVCRMVFR
jgi:hypothetical protein